VLGLKSSWFTILEVALKLRGGMRFPCISICVVGKSNYQFVSDFFVFFPSMYSFGSVVKIKATSPKHSIWKLAKGSKVTD
jgi:hypothetical protein